jgi:uncharacterized protein (TIGR02594 family)
MSKELKELKVMRAKVRKVQDTIRYYRKLFMADGTIDADEQEKLTVMTNALIKIEDAIDEKESKLSFGDSVTNNANAFGEKVSDIMSSKDDAPDHSLVNETPAASSGTNSISNLEELMKQTEAVRESAKRVTDSVQANVRRIEITQEQKDRVTTYVEKAGAFVEAFLAAKVPVKNAFKKAHTGYFVKLRQNYNWCKNQFLPKVVVTEGQPTPANEAKTEDEKYQEVANTPAVKEFLAGIHRSEGGYVDDPNDPGGKTKYGIAEKREWPAFAKMFGMNPSDTSQIRNITKEQVDEYYIKSRFEENGLDKIESTKVINAIFDQSILTPGIVKKNIKRALNDIGRYSFAANNTKFNAEEIRAINGSDDSKLVAKFVDYQNAYYDSLVRKNPTKFGKYIKGWKNRTARLNGFKPSNDGGGDTSGAASSGGNGDTHTVASGESLGIIARKYGVSVDDIVRWNNITNPNRIGVGQELIVKQGSSSNTGGGSSNTHTVASGESLGIIARKYGVSVNDIVQWNNITNPNKISVGQELTIKGGSTTSSDNSSGAADEGTTTDGKYIVPSWIKKARSYKGESERGIRMVKDHPFIKELFQSIGTYDEWAKAQTIQTANWCAAFVSYCLKNSGQSSLSGYPGQRARSYADFGTKLDKPAYGAIVVFKRGGAGHVGFVVGVKGNKPIVLGGNQGNKVSEVPYSNQVIAYVAPPGWNVPQQNWLK